MIVAILSEAYANHHVTEERRIREFIAGICKIFSDSEFEFVGPGLERGFVNEWTVRAAILVGYGGGQQLAAAVDREQADFDAVAGFTVGRIEHVCGESRHSFP